MPDEDAPEEQGTEDDFEDDDLEEEAVEADAELIARLVYEVPLQRRKEQREENRTLDNWLATTRTVSAAMVALFGVSLILAGDAANRALASGDVRASLITAAVLFISTFIASLVPYLTEDMVDSPQIPEFMDSARRFNAIALLWMLGEAIALATEDNEELLRRKGRWVNIATILATLTAIAIAVSAILAIVAARSWS